MIRLFFNILAISNDKNKPSNVTNLTKLAQHFTKKEKQCQNICQTCKILPKWQNLANSGYTVYNQKSKYEGSLNVHKLLTVFYFECHLH